MAGVLTLAEKVRIRHHLGFLNVQAAATFVLGTPASVETQFIIENAMNLVLDEALGLVRELIGKCDSVEAQYLENTENLAVDQVGSIKLRADEGVQLMGPQGRYATFRESLANALGIYPNPYDKRQILGGGGINVPVRG